MVRDGLARCAGAAALALLAACTTTHHAPDPVRTAPTENAARGTVVVSLTANTPELRAFDSITLTRLDASGKRNRVIEERAVLRNVLPGGTGSTTLFVGAVEAGDYELRQLASSGLFLPLPSAVLSAFSVRANEVTDLGRLVLTSVNEQGMVGRSLTFTSNESLVRSASPDHLRLYQRAPSLGWNAPRKPGDNAEAYARNHPLAAGGFRRLSNGEWVGGAGMGTLLVRSEDGRWRSAVTTEMERITAVVPYEREGTLAIAGSDGGALIRLRRNGALETLDRGDLPPGAVVFLDYVAGNRHWIVGLRERAQAVFYVSPTIKHGQWTPIGATDTPPRFGVGEPARLWAWAYPGGFGFVSSVDPTLSCFDYASGQWTTGTGPMKRAPKSLLAAEDGTVGVISEALPGQTGPFQTAHWTRDCGRSWTEVATPPGASASAPLLTSDGTVLRAGSDTAGPALFVSRDGGRSWTRRALPAPVLKERLWAYGSIWLLAGERLGVEELYSSRDQGQRWSAELSRVSGADALPASRP